LPRKETTMRRWFPLGALLTVLLLALPPAVRAGDRVVLAHDPVAMLQEVARHMNVSLRPDVPPPAIFLESRTPLAQFQDAIAAQWGFRPPRFTNAYAAARNEIYLIDDASYYRRVKRTLDESLAHELAHYVQVRYFDADLSDPSSEVDAVAVQQRFRAY
jgi:hypothetical protein